MNKGSVILKQYIAKITSKSQLVIPQEVREILNLKQGDYVIFEVDEKNEIKIKKGKIIAEGE